MFLIGEMGPPWLAQWLTPVWLLGMGTALGLLAALALWGILFVLSRIPVLGTLSDDPSARKIAVAIGSVILLIAYFAIGSREITSMIGDEAKASLGPNPWAALLLLSPICVLIPFTLVQLMNRRTVQELPLTLSEGPMRPMLVVLLLLASTSLLGFVVVRKPAEFYNSISRLTTSGTTIVTADIPPLPEATNEEDLNLSEIPLNIRRDELRRLVFLSSENVEVFLRIPTPEEPIPRIGRLDLAVGVPQTWNSVASTVTKFFQEPEITKIMVRNLGSRPANLKISVVTSPSLPQVVTIPITALVVFALVMAYVMQSTLMPRISAVALATYKSETAQPMFLLLIVAGVFMLVLFSVVPYNTFGEDIKMLKDAGVKLIMVLTIIQAVWAASNSVSEEIEGRTALTVLSKPLTRSSFITGKFLGIAWTVILMYVVFGAVLLVVVAYKPVYDEREGGFDEKSYAQHSAQLTQFVSELNWQICHLEMTSVAPGIILAAMETIVLAAISVAISTRLPMLANFVICFTIYVLGNLTPLIVQSSVGRFEIVQFVGQFIALIVPNLDSFDIQAAVASGQSVPIFYIGWTMLYSLIYMLIALLIALFLFEDRDMA